MRNSEPIFDNWRGMQIYAGTEWIQTVQDGVKYEVIFSKVMNIQV